MISVIIPTYHRNEHLAKCLDCLQPGAQTLESGRYEVIVADDGTAITAEKMIKSRFPWARWVEGPKKGPAANRNCGASFARGEWLAFTDDDCLPDQGWLLAYIEAIRTSARTVFEGKTYADRPKRSFMEFAPVNEYGGNMPSCNFIIHRTTFQTLKGFDENFPFSYEDVDFFHRLGQSGEKPLFVPQASVCHPWRLPSRGKLGRNLVREKAGFLLFISKHPEIIRSINSVHYLKVFTSGFILMLFNAFRYKGSGMISEMRERLFELELAVELFPRTLLHLTRLKR